MEYGPIRSIEGDTILSPYLPRLGIRFSPNFIYLGDLQYISRETYHVEEFIFLNPSGIGHVKELLLVQFSGYLEHKAGAYEIRPHQAVSLDGEDYQHEVHIVDVNDYLARYPESDVAHAADYIRQRAYTLAGEMIYHRFARLVSNDRRNQFIIAFLEANHDSLLTNAALQENESQARALLDRALNSFTILH